MQEMVKQIVYGGSGCELGRMGGERRSSDGPGSVSCRFSAVVHGLEKGGAGDSVVVDKCVDGDLVVRPGDGLGCITGVRGWAGGSWGYRRAPGLRLGWGGGFRRVDDAF
jgi:hypothetical protein